MKGKKKLLIIIGIIILILLILGIIFFVTRKPKNIFERIITSMESIKEDENLYIKVVNDEINVRNNTNVSSSNRIGIVYENDVYLVKNIVLGNAYYWYYIVDAENNEGYIASGSDELYINTFVKNKSEDVELSTISGYIKLENNNESSDENNKDFTIEYKGDKTTRSFIFNYKDSVVLKDTEGKIVEPEKLYFTCKDSRNKEVDCDFLNEENNYTVTINAKYNWKMKTLDIKLSGSGNHNNYSVDSNTTTTTTTTSIVSSSTTSTTTTTTIGVFTASGSGGTSRKCINSLCADYIIFEIKANGGFEPYKCSIKVYDANGNNVVNTAKSSISFQYRKGTFRFDYTAEDAEGTKISDSKLLTFS